MITQPSPASTPPTATIMRGPMRSTRYPSSGTSQVSAITKSVKATWIELKEGGRIVDHPVFPGKQGPAARRIEGEDDVRDVIALMRLNYERAVPLT